MKIDKFEDLISWQEARKLTNAVYSMTKNFEKNDSSLVRQMRRASVSIMFNISEGFGRHTFNDSKQFYTVSRGSVAELQSHMYIAKDLGYIKESDFGNIYSMSIKVNKLINGMINNCQKQFMVTRVHRLTNPRTRELENSRTI